MIPNIRLVPNQDGTCDLFLEYSRMDVEFAKEFDVKKNLTENSKRLSDTIASYAKKATIKSVKIFVAGALIASVAFSSFFSVFAASDRYVMGYLYSGTDQQQIEYVSQTNGVLDTVSPSYFDIEEDGSLRLNYLSEYLIESMHAQGIKVVPFLSNHWNRTAGINALKNVESLSTQIADYVEEYNLDGVNVDIENVTHEQREQYTELVRLLREKIPSHKEVSVAVAANPNDWQTGWHGSYDYAALAAYADHLFIMAYDEHHEGGEAGPVASIDFVERSIQYALEKTTPDKIVVGIPFYGRVWGLDSSRITGKGISSKTIQEILSNCESTITYDESTQSVKAEFTITASSPKYTVGGDFVLEPGDYVVWFENDQSYAAKLNLIQKYNLKGAGSWALGQEEPSIWENYEGWINGGTADGGTETPTTPVEPSEPEGPSGPEAPETEEPSEDNTAIDVWIVAGASNVPVYKNANLKGKTIASLSGGTSITLLGAVQNGVYQVQLSDGQTGYLSASYVTTTAPSTPSAPTTPSKEYTTYTVKKGDTLWRISATFLGEGKRYTEIMALNGLTNTELRPGMKLKIPAATTSNNGTETATREYTVKRGDTLWKIASAQLGAGNRYPEIKTLNGLTSDTIYTGQVLKLPK